MLSQQLKELERSELISRKDFGEVPPKVEYSITDFEANFISNVTLKYGV